MNAKVTQHPWSSEALFNKALLYVGEMQKFGPTDWQFGLWSSLSLELLARAAVAYISPTLLADGRKWRNINHALGHPPTAKAFTPTSVQTNQLLDVLKELVPDFTKELSIKFLRPGVLKQMPARRIGTPFLRAALVIRPCQVSGSSLTKMLLCHFFISPQITSSPSLSPHSTSASGCGPFSEAWFPTRPGSEREVRREYPFSIYGAMALGQPDPVPPSAQRAGETGPSHHRPATSPLERRSRDQLHSIQRC